MGRKKSKKLKGGGGIQIVSIESDLWEDDEVDTVPRHTDLSELRPPGKIIDLNRDMERYNEYEAALEGEYYETIGLPIDKWTLIRTPKEMRQVCAKMESMISIYE